MKYNVYDAFMSSLSDVEVSNVVNAVLSAATDPTNPHFIEAAALVAHWCGVDSDVEDIDIISV